MTDQEMRTALESFLDSLVLNGKSANTVRAYRSDLEAFIAWCGPEGIMSVESLRTLIPQYLNFCRPMLKPATVKRKVSSLRSFGQFCLDDKSFLSAYSAPKVAPGRAHPLPDGMDDVRRMLAAARRPHHRALIAMTGMLGLRISEARSVRPEDFSDDSGDVILTVRGKGDKTREVPVMTAVMIELAPAIDAAVQNGTTLVPINDRSARKFITRSGRRAKIARPISSHDMRHTFATAVYNKSKDIRATQELLGHSSVETTQVYTGVSEATKRAAVDV